jgi:two-component system, cell cycle sensor histidine kinase and response regulator CckA
MANDRKSDSSSPWALLIFIGMVSLFLALGGYWFYRQQAQSVRDTRYSELKAIAELKVNQIVAWRQEQLADARLNSTGIVRQYVLQWLNRPEDAAQEADIRARLQEYRELQGYEYILLAAPDGRLLLSLNLHPTVLEPTAQLVAQAASSRIAVFGDFFRCPVCNRVHLDVAAPILDHDNRPVAALILRIDPEQYLYPLIQSWPMPSVSAETLLTRKDGDDALFLNPLRHRPDPALTLRIPLSLDHLPASQAALGKTGVFEGRDYRSVNVLADIRPIAGSAWFMVAKVDAFGSITTLLRTNERRKL